MAILKKGSTIGVCVHHSVYKPANNITELKAQAKLFDTWHKSKDWAETIKTPGEFGYQYIEYHYLLGLDGSLLQVQDEKYVLYHSGDNFRRELSFNLHGVAVCLTGNYENDVPTEAQMKTLVKLVRDVQDRYKIDALVRGHKQTSKSATACPGKNIGTSTSGWLKQVIANVNDPNYPPTPPEPPQDTECQKRVKILEGEVSSLKEALATSQSREKVLVDRVGKLENDIVERDHEIGVLTDDYKRVLGERNRFEAEKLELQEELDELKQGRDDWINRLADILHKLFGGK